MVTVRREKDSMGAIEVPADKLWGADSTFAGAFSDFHGENARLAHSRSGVDQARCCEGQPDLGLLAAEKPARLSVRLMKCWRENMLMSFRWRFGRPGPVRKAT